MSKKQKGTREERKEETMSKKQKGAVRREKRKR